MQIIANASDVQPFRCSNKHGALLNQSEGKAEWGSLLF